jgi:hypothetical protein
MLCGCSERGECETERIAVSLRKKIIYLRGAQRKKSLSLCVLSGKKSCRRQLIAVIFYYCKYIPGKLMVKSIKKAYFKVVLPSMYASLNK